MRVRGHAAYSGLYVLQYVLTVFTAVKTAFSSEEKQVKFDFNSN